MGSQYRQIGNAVAVKFALKIGEEFRKIEKSELILRDKKTLLAV